MNIIVGQDLADSLSDRYIILPLDIFKIDGHTEPIPSFCVIETVPLHEMSTTTQWQDLHKNLLSNYQKRNWDFCQHAIEHLMGRWNGVLDSFYQDLLARVNRYQENNPEPNWSHIIDRQNKYGN